jgi:protocatechuate 3,4-dioxygenase beta subunit
VGAAAEVTVGTSLLARFDPTVRGARRFVTCATLLIAVVGCARAEESPRAAAQPPLPTCEWCGADEAPEALTWDIRIAGPDEPGEPLTVSGTVFESDGKTPAPGVILYLYHANAKGVYPKRGDETGNGRRHGYLRGWLRTDERGRYRFTTVRPAAYPSRTEPAHIHVTVKEPDRAEYYIDSFLFEGDELITPRFRERLAGRGGSGIIALARDADGRLVGTREIRLEP